MFTSRRFRRGPRALLPLLAAAVLAATTLTACGDGDAAATPSQAAESLVPDYYPAEYSELIEASKKEGGELVIYSNIGPENWAPIFRDFTKKYPWVTDISANDLGSDEVFQRVTSESATGTSPADILVSNAAHAWAKYAADPAHLVEYQSPELKKLPNFSTLMPNVYAMSADPMMIAYNASLMPDRPTGLGSLAKIVAQNPELFRDKITARDVDSAFGFTVAHAFTEGNPQAWSTLEKLLPLAKQETSSGTQNDKIVTGDYLAGFFIAAAPAYPVAEKNSGVFEVTFLDDGTVVVPRGIGIAPESPHANTAKLFLDFVISTEGQRAVAEGGLTAYRDDVQKGDGRHTYREVVDAVGQENVFLVQYSPVSSGTVEQFVSRWNNLLQE